MYHVSSLCTVAVAVVACAGDPVVAANAMVRVGDEHWFRTEWRASTFRSSEQGQASLAVQPDGSIVVAWSSRRQQDGRYGVYGQRFDGDGVAIGEEFRVNLWTQSHQWAPALASAGSATWAVWESHGQDGEDGTIIARRFSGDAPEASDMPDGSTPWRGGSEQQVNQSAAGHQSGPVAAGMPDGGVLIAWTSTDGDDPTAVRARRLDAAGRPVGDELSLCSEPGVHQRTPAVAVAADGSFAIAYAESEDDPGFGGIRLQIYDASGHPMGFPIDAAGAIRKSQVEPAVAAAPGGGFIVTWLDAESDGSDYGVLARLFDGTGVPRGDAFVVNEHAEGAQNAAAIATMADGRFAVAYNAPSDQAGGRSVRARVFDASGRPAGGFFALSSGGTVRQVMREASATQRLAFSSDGILYCAWNGDAGLGDDSGAHVTRMTRRVGERVAATVSSDRLVGVTDAMLPADADAGAALPAMAAEPHRPPVFDPSSIDTGKREVVMAGGDTGFTAVINTGWTPPDPHMAVGPTHIVVMTNGEISFWSKLGTRTFRDEIEGGGGFWGGLGATGFVFDPEVIFDEMSGRFFAMAAERENGGQSYGLVAVSDDSDPNGTWHKYRFNTTAGAGPTFDSPNIGVDADVVYLTGDGFGGPDRYPIFTFDKASLLAGDPPAVSVRTRLSTSTQSAGIPPVSYDAPPALYMIEHREGSSETQVRLVAMQDPLGTPTFTTMNLSVPTYGSPEDPPQSGTSSRPNTFDARFWSVAYRNGSLWATHHVYGSRVLARWYEIAMNGWPDSGDTPTLVQSGDIDPGAGVRTFFPSITVDPFGNAAMTYARSASNEFISMATAYRYRSDPLGEFRPGVQRAVNSGPYTSGRWGDYSAINPDPTNGKTIWAHHEYADGGNWRTWVQGFTPDFNMSDVNCDGVVDFNDLLLVLAAWGPCDDCPEDIDGNDVVDFTDILLVLSEWGG